MEGKNCQAGCKHFTGGEVRHHKDCQYYKDSFSEMYDLLRAEVDRFTKDEKLLIQTLREEFLVNTENYPREYHALFSEKFNRAIETFQSTRIK